MSSGKYVPGSQGQDPRASHQGGIPSVPDHRPVSPAPEPAVAAPAAIEEQEDQVQSQATENNGESAEKPAVTRAGVVWVAVLAALVLLILLIIFILQNQAKVDVRYFGFEGTLPLGMGLFIASVAGGILVAAAGGVRILQLRSTAKKARGTRNN